MAQTLAKVQVFGTQADLARRTGLSKAAITRARQTGKIEEAVEPNGTINLQVAAKLLHKNTVRPRGRAPANLTAARRTQKVEQVDRLQAEVAALRCGIIPLAEGCS